MTAKNYSKITELIIFLIDPVHLDLFNIGFKLFHDGGLNRSSTFGLIQYCFKLFHDGGLYHIEISPLICSANQWTGFYMIGAFVMKKFSAGKLILLEAASKLLLLFLSKSRSLKRHLSVDNKLNSFNVLISNQF